MDIIIIRQGNVCCISIKQLHKHLENNSNQYKLGDMSEIN